MSMRYGVTRFAGNRQARRRATAVLGLTALVGLVAAALAVATGVFGNSGGSERATVAATPSAPAATTEASPEPSPAVQAVSAGLLAAEPSAGRSGGTPAPTLTAADLDMRGPGTTVSGTFRGVRLLIPKIGVDAPFTVRTVGPDGVMPNPRGPEDVAWYDFSPNSNARGGIPGVGGNAVISGHVDYINYGPAVFWRLRELETGDQIQIQLDDGTILTYVVEWNRTADAATADWPRIVAATAQESLTLITCAGQFDTATRSYDQRQIVWAVRVG